MTDKRKRKARALSAKTGMSHAAAINTLNNSKPQLDLSTKDGRLATMCDLIAQMRSVIANPKDHPEEHVQACHEDLALIADILGRELAPPVGPKAFSHYNPNIPAQCNGCGRPLLLENLYVDDGCPCNTPRGINFKPQRCLMCDADDCVKPGHRTNDLYGTAHHWVQGEVILVVDVLVSPTIEETADLLKGLAQTELLQYPLRDRRCFLISGAGWSASEDNLRVVCIIQGDEADRLYTSNSYREIFARTLERWYHATKGAPAPHKFRFCFNLRNR